MLKTSQRQGFVKPEFIEPREAAMIDLQQVQAELSHARRARMAVEAAGNEIEALVLDMHSQDWQSRDWQRVALVDALIDDSYDPHLFRRRH
jgi:hypothetical protein